MRRVILAMLVVAVALLVVGVVIGPPVDMPDKPLGRIKRTDGRAAQVLYEWRAASKHHALSPHDGNTFLGAGIALLAFVALAYFGRRGSRRSRLIILGAVVLGGVVLFAVGARVVGPPLDFDFADGFAGTGLDEYALARNAAPHAAFSPKDGNTLMGGGVAVLLTGAAATVTVWKRRSPAR